MLRTLVLAAVFATPSFAQDLQYADLGECPLESGAVVHDCRVAYRTLGTPDESRSNAVLLTTWFTGTTEQLLGLLGPDGIIDPAHYYVIAVDSFANGVSSSPSNCSVQPGGRFPEVSVRDIVRAQHRLLVEHLDVTCLHAVIGFSMGGMLAFEWVVSYPGFMSKAVPIAGSPRLGSYSLTFWNAELSVIEALAGSDAEAARIVTALEHIVLQTPRFRDRQTPRAEYRDFMRRAGEEAVADYRPNDRAAQVRVMISHDVSAPYEGSIQQAAGRVAADMLVIVAEQDHSVTPRSALQFADLVGSETLVLAGDCGHVAFFCELETVSGAVQRFLGKP